MYQALLGKQLKGSIIYVSADTPVGSARPAVHLVHAGAIVFALYQESISFAAYSRTASFGSPSASILAHPFILTICIVTHIPTTDSNSVNEASWVNSIEGTSIPHKRCQRKDLGLDGDAGTSSVVFDYRTEVTRVREPLV